MRRLLVAIPLVAAALLAQAAGADSANSWAKGVIVRLGSTITVRGTITLMLPSGAGASSRSTLDGVRTLSCSVGNASSMRGYRVGGTATIACSSGTLLRIVHG